MRGLQAVCGRARGGPEDRLCLPVDGKYLSDSPPNVNLAAIRHGISLAGVRALLTTHSHQDHLDPCVLAAGRVDGSPMHVYCNRRVAELLPIYQQFNRFVDPQRLSLHLHTMEPIENCEGEDGAFSLTAHATSCSGAGAAT